MTSDCHNVGTESKLDIRIYYEDTDAGGIVYHANYLKYAERARSEVLREHGISCSTLLENHGFQFVVRHADVSYRAPCVLDDLITVRSSFIDLGNASFTMQQNIWRGDTLLAEIKIVLVTIDTKGKAIRIPALLRDIIKGQVITS